MVMYARMKEQTRQSARVWTQGIFDVLHDEGTSIVDVILGRLDLTDAEANRIKYILSTFALKVNIDEWPSIALFMQAKSVDKLTVAKMMCGLLMVPPKMYDFIVYFLGIVLSVPISIICASCIFTSLENYGQDDLIFPTSIIIMSNEARLTVVRQKGVVKDRLRMCPLYRFYQTCKEQMKHQPPHIEEYDDRPSMSSEPSGNCSVNAVINDQLDEMETIAEKNDTQPDKESHCYVTDSSTHCKGYASTDTGYSGHEVTEEFNVGTDNDASSPDGGKEYGYLDAGEASSENDISGDEPYVYILPPTCSSAQINADAACITRHPSDNSTNVKCSNIATPADEINEISHETDSSPSESVSSGEVTCASSRSQVSKIQSPCTDQKLDVLPKVSGSELSVENSGLDVPSRNSDGSSNIELGNLQTSTTTCKEQISTHDLMSATVLATHVVKNGEDYSQCGNNTVPPPSPVTAQDHSQTSLTAMINDHPANCNENEKSQTTSNSENNAKDNVIDKSVPLVTSLSSAKHLLQQDGCEHTLQSMDISPLASVNEDVSDIGCKNSNETHYKLVLGTETSDDNTSHVRSVADDVDFESAGCISNVCSDTEIANDSGGPINFGDSASDTTCSSVNSRVLFSDDEHTSQGNGADFSTSRHNANSSLIESCFNIDVAATVDAFITASVDDCLDQASVRSPIPVQDYPSRCDESSVDSSDIDMKLKLISMSEKEVKEYAQSCRPEEQINFQSINYPRSYSTEYIMHDEIVASLSLLQLANSHHLRSVSCSNSSSAVTLTHERNQSSVSQNEHLSLGTHALVSHSVNGVRHHVCNSMSDADISESTARTEKECNDDHSETHSSDHSRISAGTSGELIDCTSPQISPKYERCSHQADYQHSGTMSPLVMCENGISLNISGHENISLSDTSQPPLDTLQSTTQSSAQQFTSKDAATHDSHGDDFCPLECALKNRNTAVDELNNEDVIPRTDSGKTCTPQADVLNSESVPPVHIVEMTDDACPEQCVQDEAYIHVASDRGFLSDNNNVTPTDNLTVTSSGNDVVQPTHSAVSHDDKKVDNEVSKGTDSPIIFAQQLSTPLSQSPVSLVRSISADQQSTHDLLGSSHEPVAMPSVNSTNGVNSEKQYDSVSSFSDAPPYLDSDAVSDEDVCNRKDAQQVPLSEQDNEGGSKNSVRTTGRQSRQNRNKSQETHTQAAAASVSQECSKASHKRRQTATENTKATMKSEVKCIKAPSDIKQEKQLMPPLTKKQRTSKLLQSTYSETKVSRTSDGRFQCDVCGQHYKEKKTLNAHMKVHLQSGKYNCSTCGRNFHNKNEWQRHEASHSDERYFVCGRCNKGFKAAPHLTDHLRTCQVGKKKADLILIKCQHCRKDFASKASLRGHLRNVLHSPYQCKFCDKKYQHFASYWRHNLTHEEGTPKYT